MSIGKYAKAISDRAGFEFPYNEMGREWNGSLVHISEFETKHPQIEPNAHKADAVGLQNARPDREENAVPNLLKTNPFTTGSASSSTITVTEIAHGRSSSDTVRFRDVVGFDVEKIHKVLEWATEGLNGVSFSIAIFNNISPKNTQEPKSFVIKFVCFPIQPIPDF